MATRFYLPSSGTPPLPSLAIGTAWEGSVSTFFRAPAPTSKSDTALTDFAARFLSTATREDCWGQWVSAPLAAAYNFTSADTLSLVVACQEGNAAVDAYLYEETRVVSGDGGTVRGTVWVGTTVTAEFSTSRLTRHVNALAGSSVSAQAGDRLVFEIGAQGATPSTAYDAMLRFGDPAATGDFTLEADSSSDLCPWVELSSNLSFSVAAPDLFLDGMWG